MNDNKIGYNATFAVCYAILLIASLVTTSFAFGCPAILPAQTLPQALKSASPKAIRLFKVSGTKSEPGWVKLSMQIDSLTPAGVLDPARSKKGGDFTIEDSDRVIFETKKFGQKFNEATAFPCGAVQMTEIHAPNAPEELSYAYMAECQGKDSNLEPSRPDVMHQEAKKSIITRSFRYEYQPKNQLLFKNLTAFLPDGRSVVVSTNSDFLIHLDMKNFFNLQFTNKDVESYVEATQVGEMGVSALINFYISVLMIKIDLKMATQASFFEDSSNIPMIVDVPVDGESRLNVGSGMFYTFNPERTVFSDKPFLYSIPVLTPDTIKLPPAELAKIGEKNCADEKKCIFALRGHVENQAFAVAINVPRDHVKRGFFPRLVKNVSEFKTSMGWSSNPKEEDGTLGLYYEYAGLKKGRFKMDYWIGFTDDRSDGTCPSPSVVSRTLDHPNTAKTSGATSREPSH
jgi:hypothetical protein